MRKKANREMHHVDFSYNEVCGCVGGFMVLHNLKFPHVWVSLRLCVCVNVLVFMHFVGCLPLNANKTERATERRSEKKGW